MTDKKIKTILYALSPFMFAYFISMFIYPFTQGDWKYVQAVWDRWQSLNVGMLALAASGIALYASHHYTNRQYKQDNKQRERDFVAARAFLPDALSSLCKYLKSCSTLLIEAYNLNPGNNLYERLPPSTLSTPVPVLPADYKETFSKCISLAEPEMGDHLAKILRNLQINQSRLSSLPSELNEYSHTIVSKLNILDSLHRAGEIQASINIVFDAARGERQFETHKLSKDDFITAYRGLEIVRELNALVEYTARRLG